MHPHNQHPHDHPDALFLTVEPPEPLRLWRLLLVLALVLGGAASWVLWIVLFAKWWIRGCV